MRARWLFLTVALWAAACGPSDGPNRPPTVTGSPATTAEDTPVTIAVTAADLDGDPLEYRYATPAHGAVVASGASFIVHAGGRLPRHRRGDGDGARRRGPGDRDDLDHGDAGQRRADGRRDTLVALEHTALDTPLTTLLMNDADVDGDALTITAITAASSGTAAIVGDQVRYTPAAGFLGAATFDYTVSDGEASATGTVTVNVTAVDDPPVATDDVAATVEDTALPLTAAALVANDTDPEGGALSITAVGNATHGTVALVGTTVTFTPAVDYSGSASFDYTVSDGVGTDTGTVTITVTAAPDAPVAVDDVAAATEDQPATLVAATLAANDTDADGDALTVTAVGVPSGGAVALVGGTITFTPAPNLTGTAGFDYTVSDGARTDVGHVVVTVAAVPDAPVAGDDTATTAEDTPLAIAGATLTANDVDVDGPAATVTAVAAGSHGTVLLTGTTITFTPEADYVGAAHFDYTVSDGALTDVGRVTVTVTPVNDPPVAIDDSATTAEDTPLVLAAATLAANDTDVDGPGRTVVAVAAAQHGTVALAGGTVTFTPEANYEGPAAFDYTVSDGSLVDVGTVAVAVTPVNDAPVATAGSATTNEATQVVITVTATDLDSPAVTFAAATPTVGTLGAITQAGPFAATVTYTPPAGFDGAASFTFTASDGALTSAPATVTITVVNVPVCNDGLVEGSEGCDDQGNAAGDGCSPTCAVEPGWSCAGAPSACDETCGDGMMVGAEACDDGNLISTDGCTTQCVIAPRCDVARFPAGDRFATHPTTGACYVGFDDDLDSQAAAQAACVAGAGHLATITSVFEQGLVAAAASDTQNPWIGATDDANDTDAVFAWLTGEPWGFTNFAPGQPDDDVGVGGNGECLHLQNAAGQWNDTNCAATGFVVGRVCEYEPRCGDGVIQPALGETCDDSNGVSFDGCSATCRAETLFFSEYVEGASTNKAIEIANPSLTPRNLTGCSLRLYSNGAATPSNTLALTQTIAARDVFVVCHPSSSAAILANCDLTSSTVANWNGDDAVELSCGGATVDVVGQVGFRPALEWGTGLTSTADNTLRRKCTVTAGDSNGADLFDPAAQWDGFAIDTVDNLGSYHCP
jgi:cysteine-rich repeat protein